MKNRLFLHMGPGFHCEVEKALYSELFPSVDFWNQPKVTSFAELVRLACERVSELEKRSQEPISLVAHSFGAQIARRVAEKLPLKEIVLLNSACDPFECFVNLAAYLSINSKVFTAAELEVLRKSEVNAKIEFIVKLSGQEGFAEAYWYSQTKKKDLSSTFAQFPALDPMNFVSLFSDFLAASVPTSWVWQGPVKIISSADDPLIQVEKDIKPWLKVFPQAQLSQIEKAGHYSHLENPEVARLIFS